MVRSVLLTALVLLILLNAQSLTIVIYESDRDTEDWQWHSNDSRTQIVIGFDSEQWVNTLESFDYDFRKYHHFDDSEFIPILVYLGERPDAGYEVEISSIVKQDERTVITIARRSPSKGVSYGFGPTHPYDYLLLKRSQLINEEIIVQDQYGNELVRYHQVFTGEEQQYEYVVVFQHP